MIFLKKINQKVQNHAEECDYPYFSFAIFNVIAHPIFYLIWFYLDEQNYENSYIRLGIVIFCIPLVFYKYWPTKLNAILPWYWYITITYCLPIFFTFMLLKNDFSFSWSLNSLTGIVLCILFLDHKSIIIIIPLGVILGSILYYLTTFDPSFTTGYYKSIIITYINVFLFSFLFMRRKELIYKARYSSLKF